MKKSCSFLVLPFLLSSMIVVAQKETQVTRVSQVVAASANPGLQTNAAQVQLLFFKADINNDISKLHWVTEDEHALKSYTIERSTDNRDFYPIAIMPAMNEAGQVFYKYADSAISKVSAQAVFYRLKISDDTDNFSYSSIVSLDPGLGNNSTVRNYPAPAKSNTRLK